MAISSQFKNDLVSIISLLKSVKEPLKKDVFSSFRKALIIVRNENNNYKKKAIDWYKNQQKIEFENYSSTLYSEFDSSAIKIKEIKVANKPTSSEKNSSSSQDKVKLTKGESNGS